MTSAKYRTSTFVRESAAWIIAACFGVPLFLVINIAFKTDEQALFEPFALTPPPTFDSFATALPTMLPALLHSAIIVVGALAILIALGSITAYALWRKGGVVAGVIYAVLVVGIVVPWQMGLVPLYRSMLELGLVGNHLGLILLHAGIELPTAIFLYSGFIHAVPREFDEAASVDGASPFTAFLRVIFPLLTPATITIAVVCGVFIWNDFFVQLMYLAGTGYETLPVAVYTFVTQNTLAWNDAFAAVTLALAPAILVYIVAQRWIMEGFSGGVRG